jgi:hypothetical protein
VTEPRNTGPNYPCRSLNGRNGRIRTAFEGQIKRFGRKYRFPTDALDQCSATTDIFSFSGQDTLRALDRDRAPHVKSFAVASLVTSRMACCHGTFLNKSLKPSGAHKKKLRLSYRLYARLTPPLASLLRQAPGAGLRSFHATLHPQNRSRAPQLGHSSILQPRW